MILPTSWQRGTTSHQSKGVKASTNSNTLFRKDVVRTIQKLIGMLLMLTPLYCGAGGLDIVTYSKSIIIAENGEWVSVEGTWQRISTRPTRGVPQINSVQIECDRLIHRCEEYLARLVQKTDDPRFGLDRPQLFVDKLLFRVIEWSKTTIYARADVPVADIDIRISLIDRTAERTYRETTARGSKTANPSLIHRWVLE